ncbi:MAG: 6-carboxytetrahydropterin synthase QueD [Planctomycetes bacterium]|nr:6-carboxytetrahydropterin synthase QueD [Planctomycetota bacterium]
MHVRLVKSFGFEAAHWLPTFPEGHKCRRMHGHSFRVDVVVEGQVSQDKGYLIDYGKIEEAVKPLRQQLDHQCLNEVRGLENPTSEILAQWIWDHLQPQLPLLAEIAVHETCSARCVYRGPASADLPLA